MRKTFILFMVLGLLLAAVYLGLCYLYAQDVVSIEVPALVLVFGGFGLAATVAWSASRESGYVEVWIRYLKGLEEEEK